MNRRGDSRDGMLYFSYDEFACKCGCGFDSVSKELVDVLTGVRQHFLAPVIITSGCRCAAHNDRVGGSKRSQHVMGRAADFRVAGTHADRVADYLIGRYPGRYGIGRYSGRTHVDVRPNGPARWDFRDKG